MKRYIDKLASISGLLWFVTDVLWYWKINQTAFAIGLLTLLSTACLFLNKRLVENFSNLLLLVLLTDWLVINMFALAKDAFVLPDFVGYMFDTIVACLVITAVLIIIGLFKRERNIFDRFKRF